MNKKTKARDLLVLEAILKGEGNPNHDDKGRFASGPGEGTHDETSAALGTDAEAAIGTPAYYEKREPEVADRFRAAKDLKEVNSLKREYTKQIDAGAKTSEGAVRHFYEEAKERIRISTGVGDKQRTGAEARMDQLLHTTDSSGRRTGRKMNAMDLRTFVGDVLIKVGARHGKIDRGHLASAHDAIAKLVDGAHCNGATKETIGKAGARHSATDLDRIRKAHDLICEVGADCPTKE